MQSLVGGTYKQRSKAGRQKTPRFPKRNMASFPGVINALEALLAPVGRRHGASQPLSITSLSSFQMPVVRQGNLGDIPMLAAEPCQAHRGATSKERLLSSRNPVFATLRS